MIVAALLFCGVLTLGCTTPKDSPEDTNPIAVDTAESDTTECDGLDLASDAANCGECGNACGEDEECVESTCVPECALTEALCDGACTDLTSDAANCGECGNACSTSEECHEGACTEECAAEETRCDGTCADLDSDAANCGECGNACSTNEVCEEGSCSLVCPEGTTPCGDACVDTSTDAAHCGACDNTCDTGSECLYGTCASPCTGNDDCDGDDLCVQPELFDPAQQKASFIDTSVEDNTCHIAPDMYCGDPLDCASGSSSWQANFCDGFTPYGACALMEMGYVEKGYYLKSLYQ